MVTDAILRLQHINFEGAGLYRQPTQRIPLAKQGKVLLSGEEGAGKSMLPEVMTLVLYGKGSPRLRKTGLVESSIVNTDVGYRGELAFESGSGPSLRSVSITQAFKHPRLKSRYIITVDGQREEPTTKPEQKKLVKRLAPLSYEEWLGVVYLPQGGIHDLLAGTPTEKREYLTSVFGLDFYDDLIVQAKEEQKALAAKAVGAQELQQRLVDLEQEASELEGELSQLPSREDVDSAVTKFQQRLQDISHELGRLEVAEDNAAEHRRALATLNKSLVEGGWSSVKEAGAAELVAAERVSVVNTKVAELQASLREAKRIATDYDAAQREVKKREAELTKAEAQRERCSNGLHIIEGIELKMLDEAMEILKGAVEFIDEFDGKTTERQAEDWRKLVVQAQGYREQAARLTKLEAKLSAHKHTTQCPTCTQELDLESLRSSIKSLEREASVLLKKAQADVTAAVSQALQYQEALSGPTADTLRKVKEGIAEWEAFEEACSNYDHQVERLTDAKTFLAKLPVPATTEVLQRELEDLEDERRKARLEQQRARAVASAVTEVKALERALGDVDLDGLEAAIEKLRLRRDKNQTKFKEAVAIKEQGVQLRASLKALNRQRQDLLAKVAEHADNALKLKAYEIDILPYFNALRSSKVRSCVSVLEGVLPVYVGAMAASQYTGAELKLTVSDDLKDVDLQLRAGRHMPWISAVQASGGQRRRFTLAIIAALREVSPRKANIMFFDEPFADLEGEGKLLFVNRLIPALMDRCSDLESLFLIAHDAEVLQAGNDAFDSVWTVDRDEHGSKLTMGQRLSVVLGR